MAQGRLLDHPQPRGGLFDGFHGIELLGFEVLHQHHFSETSSAEYLEVLIKRLY